MAWGWLMRMFRRSEPLDRRALRDEMKRTDPEFRHVSGVQHDTIGLLGAARNAKQVADGRSIRREREFWTEHGGQQS